MRPMASQRQNLGRGGSKGFITLMVGDTGRAKNGGFRGLPIVGRAVEPFLSFQFP